MQIPNAAPVATLAAATCGAALGFLRHNFNPAKIFMGDVGSAFLGFTFAFIALAALHRTPRVALAGVLLLWPFIFDSGFTVIRRFMRGENIFVAHRSHLYQRLALAGWSQPAVTSLYGLFALLMLGLSVAWWLSTSSIATVAIVAAVLMLSVTVWGLVVRTERSRAAY